MGKVKRHLEDERSLSHYKRMPRVVCKISEEEDWERDSLKRKGQQAGCISQERLGTFPKEIFCLEVAEIYCC